MRNKIYFFNLPSHLLDISLACSHYEIHFVEGDIQDFALFYSQGVVVFDPENKVDLDSYDYYREIVRVTRHGLKEIISAAGLLHFLDTMFGRERLANPKQFRIITGSIVRSKVQTNLGAGIVKEIQGEEMIVHFPKAKVIFSKSDFVCHKSVLRVVSHLKEVQIENQQAI